MAKNDTETSPLQECVEDAKECTNEIDEILKQLKKSKSIDVLQYQSFIKKQKELEGDIDDITADLQELRIEDEPTKPKNFDRTKSSTIKKMESSRKQLETTLIKLKPPELKDTISTDSGKKKAKSKSKDKKLEDNEDAEAEDSKDSKNKLAKDKKDKSKNGAEKDEANGDDEDEEEEDGKDKKKKKDKKSRKSKSGDDDEEEDEKEDGKDKKKKKDKKSKKSKSVDDEDEEEEEEDGKDKKKQKDKKSKSDHEEDEDEDEIDGRGQDSKIEMQIKEGDSKSLNSAPSENDNWNSDYESDLDNQASASMIESTTAASNNAVKIPTLENTEEELDADKEKQSKKKKSEKGKDKKSKSDHDDDEDDKKSKKLKSTDSKNDKKKLKNNGSDEAEDKSDDEEKKKDKKSKDNKKDKDKLKRKDSKKEIEKSSSMRSNEKLSLDVTDGASRKVEESINEKKMEITQSTPTVTQQTDQDDEYEEDDFESDDEEEVQETIASQSQSSLQASTVPSQETADARGPAPKPRTVKDSPKQEEESGDDSESYTDEDEAEDEEDEEDETLKNKTCTVLKTFSALEKDDLSVAEGENLTVVRAGKSGWWRVRNSKGGEGTVPGNRLKIIESHTQEHKKQVVHKQPAVANDTMERKPYRSAKIKSGKELWTKVSEALDTARMNDIIKHHFHITPSGFRMTTLGTWKNKESNKLGLCGYLSPRLSPSQFELLDLQYDIHTKQLRPREAKFQRVLQIQKLFQIPVLSTDIEILQRNTRVCLFNGEKAISNIHLVQCGPGDQKTQKQWTYNSKVNDQMNSIQHAEIFLRFNHPSTELNLLLEFSVVLHKPNSPDNVEMSIGWVTIPLYTTTNQPIANKSFDFELNGGTPFESGIPVEPGLTAQPKVCLKLSQPNAATKEILNTLPDIIIGNLVMIQLYSYYRQLLAESLIRDRPHLSSNKPIFSPFLSTFPRVAEQLDIMDILRFQWINAQKRDKKLNKKDPRSMRTLFQKVFMETAYPIACLSSLPFYNPNVNGVVLKRQEMMNKLIDVITKSNVMKAFQNGDFEFYPVTPEEMVFSISSPYCVAESVNPTRE